MASQLCAEDKAKAVALLKDLKLKIGDLSSHVKNLQDRVDEKELSTAKGVSFLEVKYQMLLSYLVNLTQVMCNKTHGKSIVGNKSILRLVEIRTVLEKMRPIDQKLKYQIDKIIKTAATGSAAENDPLRFKPNPNNMESKLDDDDDSDSESGEEKPKSGLYRPPKLAAVKFDEDETLQEQQQRLMEKKKKRILSGSIMRDLKAQYEEGPEEIKETPDMHRAKHDKAGKEREEYEEKTFTRLTVSKKELNANKRMRTMGDLDYITKFGDLGGLNTEGNTGDLQDEDGRPRKKRKVKSGKSGKGKKGSKKKFRRR